MKSGFCAAGQDRRDRMQQRAGRAGSGGCGTCGRRNREAEIREEWREEIVRRAQALSVRVETYTQEALEAMTNADLEIILAGMGISANMNKANMVTLILAMQGGDAL